MITKLAALLFDVLLCMWPLSWLYHEHLGGKAHKRARQLKMMQEQLRHRRRWDRDILTKQQREELDALSEQVAELAKAPEADEKVQSFVDEKGKESQRELVPRLLHITKEWVELLVVVLGVVMGFRALIYQPFKIPTGSMQPTLHGINFIPSDKAPPNRLQRVVDYVNNSWRYVDIDIRRDGMYQGSTEHNPAYFFPVTDVQIGGEVYRLPGHQSNVERYLQTYRAATYPNQRGQPFAKGEKLARGYLELGDHLFVNRWWLNFFEPRRGGITVFVTTGIKDRNGRPLSGPFYIKRLVGMPGDTLRITDGKLYVKEPGKEAFRLVDGDDHLAFQRIYSFKGGYRGYTNPDHPHAQYLTTPESTFTLGPDEYFMLGDNTTNSQDSRFWGVVPRRNLIGVASVVYWPFLRRWGFADQVQPLAFDSPPTYLPNVYE